MQVDVNKSNPHFWFVGLWCALGGLVLVTIAVISCWIRKCRSTYRKKKKKHVRRAQSVAEFETRPSSSVTTTNKRLLFRGRSVSSEQDNSENEHSEKSPLVTAKLDSLAKLLFSKSLLQDNGNGNRECDSPTRHSTRYQYTALDNGIGASDRSPRERAARDRALTACQEWIQASSGRYEIIAHLDDIGSRPNKQWFLLNDTTVRTDRLMTLLPLPPDCVALEELPPSENPKGILMELLGSLQHPYIYPVLDLGFLQSDSHNYACLVMPFNPRGSLKDLIYKSQWNEPWNRKYTRKSTCLPISQVQRLGRQILEALLFLRERGFPSHGHLHSGNVILQNGVARLSGLENGLLGLNSRVNAVNWSRADIDHIDVICFGHLLFEMCAGYELGSPQPSPGHLELELERYPQVAEVLSYIFDSCDGRYPTIEELVLCDLFRNIDLREMRGTCIPSFKHGLSNSTLSLLNAVRRRQGVIISSHSEGSSPCTPPSTPRDRRTGEIETDLTSDSDIALDEIVIEQTASIDYHHYDPLNSPIHFCDNANQSDDNCSSIIRINADDLQLGACGSHHTSSSSASASPLQQQTIKNSKYRRLEYSQVKNNNNFNLNYNNRDNIKLGVISKSSQDSAFGSMTDGDISITSSLRLSSFQSISSPIDEGVEIIDLNDDNDLGMMNQTTIPLSLSTSSISCHSTPLNSSSNNQSKLLTIQSQSISLQSSPNRDNNITITSSASTNNVKTNLIFLEPPTLLINNQRSIYTSSPSKRNSSIEVFSQKYRVSSYEDMSLNLNPKTLKNFHSFDDKYTETVLTSNTKTKPAYIQPDINVPSTSGLARLKKYNTTASSTLSIHSPLSSPSSNTQQIQSTLITGFTSKSLSNITNINNRVIIKNTDKLKKLKHSTFINKIVQNSNISKINSNNNKNSNNSDSQNSMTHEKKHLLWKNSILKARQCVAAKQQRQHSSSQSFETIQLTQISTSSGSSSSNSSSSSKGDNCDVGGERNSDSTYSSKSNSFESLSKDTTKINVNIDNDDEITFDIVHHDDDYNDGVDHDADDDNDDDDDDDANDNDDESETLLMHSIACKKIGGYIDPDPGGGVGHDGNNGIINCHGNSNDDNSEEQMPLLDGMELSALTPTESDDL